MSEITENKYLLRIPNRVGDEVQFTKGPLGSLMIELDDDEVYAVTRLSKEDVERLVAWLGRQ